ncbi:MAG: hypothetical protein JOS17DRAFT_812912 [Linnemannia elongata]|nr:MAG: hypothetical protein JOS17DRAFT_812912 [Linnemannia elongata]
MSALTQDQPYYFEMDGSHFERMNMDTDGIRFDANEIDEDAEDIEAAGDHTTYLTYVQAFRANTTTGALARLTRKLPGPFTGPGDRRSPSDPDRTDFTESEVVGTLRELSEWRAILNTKPKVRVVEFESESESESRSDSRSGSELEFESDVEFVLELDHGGDLIGVDVEKESGGDKDQERTEELAGYQSSVDKQRGNIDAEEENGDHHPPGTLDTFIQQHPSRDQQPDQTSNLGDGILVAAAVDRGDVGVEEHYGGDNDDEAGPEEFEFGSGVKVDENCGEEGEVEEEVEEGEGDHEDLDLAEQILLTTQYLNPRIPIPASVDWRVPVLEQYADKELKIYMQLNQSPIQHCEFGQGSLCLCSQRGKTAEPVKEQLKLCLFRLGAKGVSMDRTAAALGFSKGSAEKYFWRCISAICVPAPKLIQWPDNTRRRVTKACFKEKCGLS